MNVIDILVDFFRMLIQSILFMKRSQVETKKGNQIFVKCSPDTMLSVFLEPDWTICDLKNEVSKKLCLKSEDIRIIFAGKELHDNVKLEDCDVGEQTIIHAVQQKRNPLSVTVEAKCPMNQTPFCCEESEEKEAKPVSKKSHFFVFCVSPCSDLCPGKLRVRCSTCKEKTLIVEQDPTCWDDVLIPDRISGTCHNENCSGTVAEFYFKCAKHVASGEEKCVPLYLVKNNYKNIPCIACTGESSEVLVFPCANQHVICLECFRMYCSLRLNERRFIQDEKIGYSIDCPGGCPDSLITEPHHFMLLGEQQYAKYQSFGAEEYVLQVGGVLCPQPGCGAGIIPDQECHRVKCNCGFVFCRLCMQGYHNGPCEPQDQTSVFNEIYNAIVDERATTSKWDKDKAILKPCPGCGTLTIKDGGCNHMVCKRSQCNLHWCWICQEEWSRECMGNHWLS